MSRSRAVAGWLPAVVLVPAAVWAGVVATVPDDDLAAMREEQPLDLGTTWVYDVFDHGDPSGTRTSQVSGTASLLGPDGLLPVSEQTRTYTDYPGTGPRSFTAYVAVEGSTMYQYAQEEAGTWYDVDPRIIAYRVPAEAGDAWKYDGTVGPIDYSAQTELTELVEMEVGGDTFAGCAHFVTTVPLNLADDPDAVETIEEWTCPGIGTVRVHDVAVANGTDFTEELTEFHGVEGNWYAEGHEPAPADLPDPAPGALEGFDAARTFAVPDGTLGRELAWTDLRPERALVPPASDGEVMAVAEPNGVVSLRTVDTGEMRWRVQLRGPILASPVVVGGVVVVGDSLRQVWALSGETGQALWSYRLPDVVSASPLVAGDLIVVPSDDGTLTSLDASDGTVEWETELGGAVRTPPAYDGEQVLTGDLSGSVTALDPETGDTLWSTSLDEGLAQGPVVVEGNVMVEDVTGIVHAFTGEGDIAWQSRSRGDGTAPMAAGNGVVLTTNNVQVLSAFDTSNGDRLWSRELTRLRSAPTIVGDEVLVVTRMGEVQVYGLHDGQLVDRWRLPLPADDADWFVDADPALVGDVLVLSAFGGGDLTDSALFAYPVRPDLPPGPQLHVTARPIPGIPTEPPALAGDDVVLATSDGLFAVGPNGAATQLMLSGDASQTGAAVADGIAVAPHGETVQARRLEDGELLWKSPGADPAFGAVPAIAGDTVVYPIKDQGLVAVDLHSGDPLWVEPIMDQQLSVAPLALPDGDVLYGGGGLARFDGTTGELEWRDPTAHLFAAPAYAAGTVFAVGAEPAAAAAGLAARDAATGALLWSQPVADPPLYLAPAVADGVVVSLDGSTAHAYDAETGEELWTLAMHRAAAGAPFISGGRVFLSESGNGRDIDDQSYRVSVHDLRTGRFLGAWEPDATPFTALPDVGGAPDGRLMIPTALMQLAFLEAR
jgi:outer membrane protein assembly factor BamB